MHPSISIWPTSQVKTYFVLHSNILHIPQCSCLNFNTAVCDPEHPTKQLSKRCSQQTALSHPEYAAEQLAKHRAKLEALSHTFYITLIGAKQRAVSQPLIYAFRTTISEPKQAAFKRTFRRTKWSTKHLSKRAAIGGAVRAPERVSLADEHAV